MGCMVQGSLVPYFIVCRLFLPHGETAPESPVVPGVLAAACQLGYFALVLPTGIIHSRSLLATGCTMSWQLTAKPIVIVVRRFPYVGMFGSTAFVLTLCHRLF